MLAAKTLFQEAVHEWVSDVLPDFVTFCHGKICKISTNQNSGILNVHTFFGEKYEFKRKEIMISIVCSVVLLCSPDINLLILIYWPHCKV